MKNKDKKLTKSELMLKIKALGKITIEQRNEIVCSLIGHSSIVDYCFGYVTCSRCNKQLGDALAGVYDTSKNVIVGHKCKICIDNFKNCTWRDKLYVANPFK